MNYIFSNYTKHINFFGKTNPIELIKKYGSPLYVYNENILRERCREMKNLVKYPNFSVNFSTKSNNNLQFLKIIKSEGLNVDAMSAGEIGFELLAGFSPNQILFIANNVSADEMKFAIDKGILISVDSLSQLETYGKINGGGDIVIRFNPGVGAGHSKKVITGGKNTKFGVNPELIPEVKNIIKKYNLNLIGINQHIGSLFMDSEPYLESVNSILNIAENFENLKFVDFGGGFGIPYYKQNYQQRLNLKQLGQQLDITISEWIKKYGSDIQFKIEPGRYISAEYGLLLGTVTAVKNNMENKYIGTDLGFNVLGRPILYDSHHDIEIYRQDSTVSTTIEEVTIVGNICESGDILAQHRNLPQIFEGDIIGITDAGAYGQVMSSNYNLRLRPAEVFIDSTGNDILTRRRDNFEDLIKPYLEI